jgi:hypothetical protein
MSLEDLRVANSASGQRAHRPATREDVLAAVRELGGVEVETWQRGDGYWAISPPEDSPGHYLILHLDTGDTG